MKKQIWNIAFQACPIVLQVCFLTFPDVNFIPQAVYSACKAWYVKDEVSNIALEACADVFEACSPAFANVNFAPQTRQLVAELKA